MKQCILIRTNIVDSDVISSYKKLTEDTNLDVYIFVENFSNEDLFYRRDNNIFHIGKKFLDINNLKYFTRCGWQCGDYILYAAASILGDYDYDYFWMTEPDLYLNINIKDFIFKMESYKYDLLGVHYGGRGSNWSWYKSMSYIYSEIKGMYFPFFRVSKKAALFCLDKRREYSRLENLMNVDYSVENMILSHANDESFLATTIYNNNFTCYSINNIFPKYFENYFSTHLPVFFDELNNDYLKDKIIHPVLDHNNKKVKSKFLEYVEKGFDYKRILKRILDIVRYKDEKFLYETTGLCVDAVIKSYDLSCFLKYYFDSDFIPSNNNKFFIKNYHQNFLFFDILECDIKSANFSEFKLGYDFLIPIFLDNNGFLKVRLNQELSLFISYKDKKFNLHINARDIYYLLTFGALGVNKMYIKCYNGMTLTSDKNGNCLFKNFHIKDWEIFSICNFYDNILV